MRTSLILFDVDGTLVDTAGAGRVAMDRTCERVFGIDRIADKTAGVQYAGMTDPVILEAVVRAAGIDGDLFQTARDELQRVFLSELDAEMRRPESRRRVLPGVVPLLDELEARADVHLGLATGNLEAGARAKLGYFDLNRYFAAGGYSSDHRDRREIARIAWERLSERTGIRFPPDRVVVVGDTEHDVDCARANGFRSVAVDSGWVTRESLVRAKPDVLLDDLSDRERTLRALGID